MNMSSLGLFVTSRRARSGLLDLLSLPRVLVRRKRSVLDVSDHLRRDLGLSPLDGANDAKEKEKAWLGIWLGPRW